MGGRNFLQPDRPLDIPDPESVRDEQERKHLGTPDSYTGFEVEESKKELSGASANSLNPKSAQQPIETEGVGTDKEFTRQATSFRKPTNDMDKEDFYYN